VTTRRDETAPRHYGSSDCLSFAFIDEAAVSLRPTPFAPLIVSRASSMSLLHYSMTVADFSINVTIRNGRQFTVLAGCTASGALAVGSL
jgi:hypothetical protein